MGPRTIEKRRPVSCPNIAAERPYFANYMINIQATALRDTSSERYCPCDHYEYKNGSIWWFWSKIWAIEGPNYAENSIFATVKIVFYHKFIRLLWQNYSFDRSEIFCGTRYRSYECKSVFISWISYKLLK